MSKFMFAWQHIKYIEEQSLKDTVVHRLHPLTKLMVTLVYILTVISYEKYEVGGILPLFLYPMVMINLGELSPSVLLKPMLVGAPFVLGVGIFNPLFDHTPLLSFGDFVVTGGWISFTSILVRFCFTVLGGLILLSISGMEEIAMALLRLRIPKIFVIQLLFTYRYISLLLEETGSMVQAYSLRSSGEKRINFDVLGSFVGQLLLRTMDRSQRIYQAMLCRGFTGEANLMRSYGFSGKDILYLLFWIPYFLGMRFFNIPQWIGTVLLGG